MTLAHGDAWNKNAPLVRVETAAVDGDDEIARALDAQQLAFGLFHEAHEHLMQIRDTFRASDPTASWEPRSFDLGGTNTLFRTISSGKCWVALGDGPECLISIEARHFDPENVHLVVIDRKQQYLADDGGPR